MEYLTFFSFLQHSNLFPVSISITTSLNKGGTMGLDAIWSGEEWLGGSWEENEQTFVFWSFDNK
jgi:hypothetical protein